MEILETDKKFIHDTLEWVTNGLESIKGSGDRFGTPHLEIDFSLFMVGQFLEEHPIESEVKELQKKGFRGANEENIKAIPELQRYLLSRYDLNSFRRTIFKDQYILGNPLEDNLRYSPLQTLRLFVHETGSVANHFDAVANHLLETFTGREFNSDQFIQRFCRGPRNKHTDITKFEFFWETVFGHDTNELKDLLDFVGSIPSEENKMMNDFIWICLFYMQKIISEVRFKFQQVIEKAEDICVGHLPSGSTDLGELSIAFRGNKKNDWRIGFAESYYQNLLTLERSITNKYFWSGGKHKKDPGSETLSPPDWGTKKPIPSIESFLHELEIIEWRNRINWGLHIWKEGIDTLKKENENSLLKVENEELIDLVDGEFDRLGLELCDFNRELSERHNYIVDNFQKIGMERFSLVTYQDTMDQLEGCLEFMLAESPESEQFLEDLEPRFIPSLKLFYEEVNEFYRNLKALEYLMIEERTPLWLDLDDILKRVVERNKQKVTTWTPRIRELSKLPSPEKIISEHKEKAKKDTQPEESTSLFRYIESGDKRYEIKFNDNPLFSIKATKGLDCIYKMIESVQSGTEFGRKLSNPQEGIDCLDFEREMGYLDLAESQGKLSDVVPPERDESGKLIRSGFSEDTLKGLSDDAELNPEFFKDRDHGIDMPPEKALKILEDEEKEAVETNNEEVIKNIQKMKAMYKRTKDPSGKFKVTERNPQEKANLEKSWDGMKKNIDRAKRNIAKYDKKLAEHLTSCIQMGYFIKFYDTTPWKLT